MSDIKIQHLTLNVTNSCNLNCVYCYEHNKNSDCMSLDYMKAIIDKFYNLDNKYFTVTFFGGEPTLEWNNIKEFIKYNNSLGRIISYDMTTNFTYDFTDEDLNLIANEDFFVLVSIDGNRETHNLNRCNSYDKVVENIEKFKKYNLIPRIQARMTITPERVQYLLEDVKSIYSLGVWNIAPVPAVDISWTDEQLDELEKQCFLITDYLIEELQKENSNPLEISWLNNIRPKIREYNDANNTCRSCGFFNKHVLAIAPNGDMYTCHRMPTENPEIQDKFKLGKLDLDNVSIDNNLQVIWNESKLESELDDCSKCKLSKVCSRSCPIESYKLYRNVKYVNKPQCAFHKITHSCEAYFIDSLINLENVNSKFISRIKVSLKADEMLKSIFKDILDPANIIRFSELKEFMKIHKDLMLPEFKENIMYQLEKLQMEIKRLL